MAAQAIEHIVSQYGSGISFVDYVRMLSSVFDRTSANPQVSHSVISAAQPEEFAYSELPETSNNPISQSGCDGSSMEDFQANTSDLTQVSEYLLNPVLDSDDFVSDQFDFNE